MKACKLFPRSRLLICCHLKAFYFYIGNLPCNRININTYNEETVILRLVGNNSVIITANMGYSTVITGWYMLGKRLLPAFADKLNLSLTNVEY